MTKCILLSLAAGLLIYITGCKSETADESAVSDENTVEIVQEDFLSPDKIDITKPIPVADLKKAFFAWGDKEVIVSGYCCFFFEKGAINESVELTLHPDSSSKMVECSMKQALPEEFEKTTPVTIKGKIDGTFFNTIKLKDCELVSKGEMPGSAGKINPSNPPAGPIPVNEFYNSYFGWNGKEVSVIGYYHSTTTSTTSYGQTIRVDLSDPVSGEKAVGCNMKQQPPEDLVNNRNDVVIRGTISGEVFGNVQMEDCEIVK